jgi:hypothetical protein
MMNEKWLILWVFIAKFYTARSFVFHNRIQKSLRIFERAATIDDEVKNHHKKLIFKYINNDLFNIREWMKGK